MDSRDASIEFLDERRSVVGMLKIVQADKGPPGLRVLSSLEAKEHGEERVQLIEGRAYDFELQNTLPQIRICPGGICKPSSIRPEIVRIEPKLQTGLCEIHLEDVNHGTIVARVAVEVVSSKFSTHPARPSRTIITDTQNESDQRGLPLTGSASSHARSRSSAAGTFSAISSRGSAPTGKNIEEIRKNNIKTHFTSEQTILMTSIIHRN